MTYRTEPASRMRRRVEAHLVFDSDQPLDGVLQVAASGLSGVSIDEKLTFRHDGVEVEAPDVWMPSDCRVRVLRAPAGRFTVDYEATIVGRAEPSPVSEP
ncbi:MAG TPA: hypothetical protein VG435_14680, partial [Acidimicrobiales bacterium]|nr:hypothetical protein [Acidimicrobiales bacterium]